MKFYVAGLTINHNSNLTFVNQCESLVKSIPLLVKDGIEALGNEVIVIIVLHEYALTPNSISHSEKKAGLNILQEGLQAYDNVILIPGSLSSFRLLSEKPQKIQKIKDNYSLLDQYCFFNKQSKFNIEFLRSEDENIKHQDCHYLQNSSYIFTHDHMFKRNKSSLFWEGKILSQGQNAFIKYVFDPGIETQSRQMSLKGQDITIRVLICLEHILIDEIKNFNVEPPLIEVIVSNTIELRKDQLFGALCIQMDKNRKLYAGINTLHSKASMITAVKAKLYFLSDKLEMDNPSTNLNNVIDCFEKVTHKQTNCDHETIMNQTTYGFFNSSIIKSNKIAKDIGREQSQSKINYSI